MCIRDSYSPLHRNIHPDKDIEPSEIKGLEAFSMQFRATASLFGGGGEPCQFGGCNVSLNANWRGVMFTNRGPRYPGWNDGCTEPSRNDFDKREDYFRAYESYLRCQGTLAQPLVPWSTPDCSGAKFSPVRDLLDV